MAEQIRVPEVLIHATNLYLATHNQPLALAYPDGCWEFSAGDFAFAFNGHREPKEGGPADGMRGPVPPFTLAIWRNGWLLGHVDPGGGGLVGGDANTEGEIIEALKATAAEKAEVAR